VGKLREELRNLKNTHETLKKDVTVKEECLEKMESENERRLKSQLELKCKELSDAQAKEKVRNDLESKTFCRTNLWCFTLFLRCCKRTSQC
jgi:hypothetical protein